MDPPFKLQRALRKDVSPKRKYQRSEDALMMDPAQTTIGRGKRKKKRDKEENVAPEIRCPRYDADVEENIQSECSSPGGENPFEPFGMKKAVTAVTKLCLGL